MSAVDWYATRNEIVEMALRKINALAEGEAPSGKKLDNALKNLNMLTKALQGKNLFLWNVTAPTAAPTMVAGTSEYAVTDNDVIGVYQAWLRTSGGNDGQRLNVRPYDWWLAQDDKTTAGQPTDIVLSPFHTAPRLILHPVPDAATVAAYTLYTVLVKKLRDWDSAADTNFPNWWVEALVWGLASALAPEYGLDVQRQSALAARYQEALGSAKMDNFYRPDMSFEPY